MSQGGPGGWWGVAAAVVVLTLAFSCRRRFPVAATLLALASATWCPPAIIGVLPLAYLAGRRPSRWWQSVGGLVIGLAGVPVALWALNPSQGLHPDLSLQLPFVLVVPWLIGRHVRQRLLLRDRAAIRAREWARDHAVLLERARARERDRIAADMHDALGHDLSLISLQTAALAGDDELSARQHERATLARRLTAEASERLQDIVELLSTEPPVELTALVERASAAGARVRLDTSGDARALAPYAGRLVHSVVREAITNGARHAPGSELLIRVEYGESATSVTAENRLPGAPAEGSGGGTGLARLEARLRRVGGRLDWRRDDDRFVVAARVPRQPVGPGDLASDSAADEAPADGGTDVERLRVAAEATTADLPTRAAFWRTVAAPTLAFATAIAGYSLYVMNEPVQRSAMTATTYAAVHVGDLWPSAALPASEAPLPAPEAPLPGPESGADPQCHHYARRTFGPFFDGYYRICTASGRVVSKAVTGE